MSIAYYSFKKQNLQIYKVVAKESKLFEARWNFPLKDDIHNLSDTSWQMDYFKTQGKYTRIYKTISCHTRLS